MGTIIRFVTLLLFLQLLTLPCDLVSAAVPGHGTFRMSGIFPITSTNERINHQSGVMMAEAMRYAVNMVNNRTDYLNGYKLQINEIFDSYTESHVRQNILKTFIYQIPFLIGPYSSETSYLGSILTGTFRQIAFSYSATYSDFDNAQHYMVRTVPSDKFRMMATIDVIKKLKWNYIGIISSYGYNGEREALHLISKLNGIGVCLANQIDLLKSADEQAYMNAITTMKEDKRLKALLFFTTKEDSKALLLAIQRLKLKGRFYILCIYGCTNYVEVVRGIEDVADGVISIDIHNKEVNGFRDYFLNLRPSRSSPEYFLYFWEDVFNCSIAKVLGLEVPNGDTRRLCSGKETLTSGNGYYPLTPVNSVINAVYAIADVIKSMLEDVCSHEKMKKLNKTECIIDTEKDTDRMNINLVKKIPKYYDGTVRYATPITKNTVQYDIHRFTGSKSILIGNWSIDRNVDEMPRPIRIEKRNDQKDRPIRMQQRNFIMSDRLTEPGNESGQLMVALCSQPCSAGHIRRHDTNSAKRTCCWACAECPSNSIVINNTCAQCRETETVNDMRSECVPLPRKYINLNKTEAWVFFMFSMIGLFFVSFFAVIFIRFNDNHIVRSSGRDLCYLILLGICLTFFCPIMFLTKPSTRSCIFRGALPGLAFICCYAPLFLRTNRIYRIFMHAKTSVARPPLVSTQSQLMVSCGIVAVQFLLVVVWFVSNMPVPEETVVPNRSYVNVHCKVSPVILVLNLALSVVFMILCTVLAFKTRHFPKNYNEAKYIGITLYLSCVAWAVFLPGYFLTNPKNDFLREYLMCAISIAIGYITLFGLFGRKVGMLIFGVPKGLKGSSTPSWNLSENEAEERLQQVNYMKSAQTQDMLLQ